MGSPHRVSESGGAHRVAEPAKSAATSQEGLLPAQRAVGRPADGLLLKVTPPRLQRHLITRPRLMSGAEGLRDRQIVLVQASAGFGKTSLLAQWRRDYLGQGAVVAWTLAQAQDGPQRLLQSMALALRTCAARPGFGRTLIDVPPAPGLEGFTTWLAEVARSALDVVLFVDEAERLPPESLEAVAYVLRNAPPNLRIVVAARTGCRLGIDDLVAYGTCAVVTQAMLSFRFDETLEAIEKRVGRRIDNDEAARLHETTEGWPLGLQLVLSSIESAGDGGVATGGPTPQGDTLREHFVALLLANLDAADVALLTRIAIVDPLHADLCRALMAPDDVAGRFDRIVRDGAVFIAGEAGEWVRMHSLAREVLCQRFVALPAKEQSTLHARAADWLAAHGMIEEAAGHALSAGQRDRAYALAERSLYESLMARGHQGSVLEWLARMPPAELDRRPRLLLAAAWSLALSERHREAERLVARVLAQPGADDALGCECALVLGGAAVFADDPDRFAALHDPWADQPPLREPMLLRIHANRSAYRALIEGEPALARLRQQRALQRSPDTPQRGHLCDWGDFIVGLSYLWEGQVLLAEKVLRPALAHAEGELGRRDPFSTMLAALLAAAVWERDRPAEAAAMLANRLDVLERSGLAEAVLLGYRTMARVAAAAGAENHALELLGAMHAVGVERRLPRLCIASLAEQTRLHASRFRAETCRDLCAQIDTLLASDGCPQGRLWRRSVDVLCEMARGYAAIAARQWRAAGEQLARADAHALQVKAGRLHVKLLGLRAFVLDRCGEQSNEMLREAVDLAQAYGMERVFDDAHPGLGAWSLAALRAPAGADPGLAGPLAAPMHSRPPPIDPGPGRSALTPKEREVLELLARHLSNKEIGLAMQVGEATIKWHMRNLFAKLDSGTRRQVTQRARILGLLGAE
jgi:LuxR family maltose regulon positive regulatory protein